MVKINEFTILKENNDNNVIIKTLNNNIDNNFINDNDNDSDDSNSNSSNDNDNLFNNILSINSNNFVKIKKLRQTIYGNAYIYNKVLLNSNKTKIKVIKDNLVVVKKHNINLVKNKKMKNGKNILEDPELEYKILKKITAHPNIISTLGYYEADHFSYSIFPFIKGGELFDLISKSDKLLSENLIKNIFKQIFLGVDHLHKQGVIHYDISPENILLRPNRNNELIPVIIDFGLARVLPQNSNTFNTPKICGKTKYMAPEVYHGKSPVLGRPIDIYSLASTLFVSLFKIPLYDNMNTPQFKFGVKKQRLKDLLKNWDFNCSIEVQDLLQQMFTFEPKKRITMEQILNHAWFNNDIQ